MHIYCPEGYLGFFCNERTVYVPQTLVYWASGLKDVPHITFNHHSRIARDVQYSSTVPLSLLYWMIYTTLVLYRTLASLTVIPMSFNLDVGMHCVKNHGYRMPSIQAQLCVTFTKHIGRIGLLSTRIDLATQSTMYVMTWYI